MTMDGIVNPVVHAGLGKPSLLPATIVSSGQVSVKEYLMDVKIGEATETKRPGVSSTVAETLEPLKSIHPRCGTGSTDPHFVPRASSSFPFPHSTFCSYLSSPFSPFPFCILSVGQISPLFLLEYFSSIWLLLLLLPPSRRACAILLCSRSLRDLMS